MSNSRLHTVLASVLHHSRALMVGNALSRSHELQVQALPRLRKSFAPRFVILCYHRIGTGGIPFYSELPVSEFEKQMRYLRKHCRVIALEQLVSEMEHPSTMRPGVAVTFDDGYLGTYTEAFPILRKYSIPSTVYLTVGCIETGEPAWYDRLFAALQAMPRQVLQLETPDPRRFQLDSAESRIKAAAEIIAYLRLVPDEQRIQACTALESRVQLRESELKNRMLTWDQVRDMHYQGIHFEAHTMTHPVLSRLNADAMVREIADSKRVLQERIGSEVRHFAYPFGKPQDCGALAAAVVSDLGFRSATTTVAGVNTPSTDAYHLRRVQIGENTSLPVFALRLTQLLLKADGEIKTELCHDSIATREIARSREANRA